MTTTVSIQRTCTCGRVYVVNPATDARGGGKLCPWCTKKAVSQKFGQTTTLPAPPVRRAPHPTNTKQSDWPMEGGATVLCPRCRQQRPRGIACRRCERWDCDGNPVTEVAL